MMDTAFSNVNVSRRRQAAEQVSARKAKRPFAPNPNAEIYHVENTEAFGEVKPMSLDILKNRPTYRFIKRLADVVLSAGGLLVLWPVMLGTALIIVLDDPKAGPIFVQERIGKNGIPFHIYKFRSMVHNAEELKAELEAKGITIKSSKDPTFKLEDDPRITRVGRFIRKTSIDELPQLFNVLKGDMSIVGPRPLITKEVQRMDEFSLQRHLVRPGLTCYWQSTKNRDKVEFGDWMKMDVRYIQNCSVWEDIKIICKTFRIVLTANGN